MLNIDFLVVGTQKAGTTTLHDLLAQHDDVCMPRIKETHYFSHADRRVLGPNWYRAQFSNKPGSRIIGEIDPEYMFAPEAAARVAAETSVQKVIFVLRNPIRRAYSQYLMTVRRGYEKLSFRDALLAEPKRLAGERAVFAHDHWSYAARSLYADQIATWRDTLRGAEMLFLTSDTLTAVDGNAGYPQLCRFIGTTPRPELLEASTRSNVASVPRLTSLRDFIYATKGRSPVRRAITAVLPESAKVAIFKAIDGLNQRPVTQINEIAFVDLPRTVLQAMLNDCARTAILTGLDLSGWETDLRTIMSQVTTSEAAYIV